MRTIRLKVLPKAPAEEVEAARAAAAAAEIRSAGRNGLKLVGRTTEVDPKWTALIDALVDHGILHPADLAEAARALHVKNFHCPHCGGSSGFARRDRVGRYDQVRISCGNSCGTRAVATTLGLLREPDPADPFGASPINSRKTGPR